MKTAVVTGASTGIGKTVALALGRNDYFVYLLARNQEALVEAKKNIEDEGGKAEVVVIDLSSVESINNAISTITAENKKIDVLINIAGVWHGSDEVFANKTFETFDQKTVLDTYAVGIIAPTLLSQGFTSYMMYGGKIINLSGTFESGAKGWLPYYVSKRAIEDLTIALSQELEDKGIQVNCISPSDMATEAYEKYFPQYMNDAENPERIADYVLELVKEENKTTGKIFVIKKGKDIYEGFHS